MKRRWGKCILRGKQEALLPVLQLRDGDAVLPGCLAPGCPALDVLLFGFCHCILHPSPPIISVFWVDLKIGGSSIAGAKVTNTHGIGLTRTGFHSLGLEVARVEPMRPIKEDVDPGMIFA